MTPFVLPITIRTADADIDMLIEVPGPTRLAAVLSRLNQHAGLPEDTELYLGAGPVLGAWMLGRAPLLAGCILSTTAPEAVEDHGPVNLSCIAGPDAGRWIALHDRPLLVGRDLNCDLHLDDPELSRRHARIVACESGLIVTDLRSANGVRVQGVSTATAASAPVPTGGLIRLGGSLLRAGLDTEPALLLTPDGVGHLAVARPARVAPPFQQGLPPPIGAPPARSHRPIPLLAAAAAALTGVMIAVVTGMWTFLLLAALGPVLMLATGLSDRLSGRRSHRRETTDHRAAKADEAVRLAAAMAADRDDAWDRYPDPATLARRVIARSTRLWERQPADQDFLYVSLGVGARPARVPWTEPPTVADVPITVDLEAVGVLGLAGECRPLLRNLIGQLAVLHSPANVRLSVFSEESDLARTRDLPHTRSTEQPGAMTTAAEAAAEVGRLLAATDGRTSVVVLDDAHRWRRTPRMAELLARAAEHSTPAAAIAEPAQHISPTRRGGALIAICVAGSGQELPAQCTAIATVQADRLSIAAGSATAGAEPTGVSRRYLNRLIEAMAPLVDPDAPGAGLPRAVPLADLLGPIDAATIRRRWSSPTLIASVGVGAAGEISIDLERDGPHVLIAGTTGSGKSELLTTLLAGLACAAPPNRTAFLLVDYKGGATFGRLAELPHTTGVVSDLDKPLAARALLSLRAEVRRRERLLATTGAADIAGLRARPDGASLPSLVIVVDEFATLSTELPEFLTGLVDIAQRGRSLGLHLVLATQRPAGVLSPAIKANIGLRICLRVTDDADSIDVIDTPEAARLTRDPAGRALVRRGRSRTEVFQVATVSWATLTSAIVRMRDLDRPGSIAGGESRANGTDLDDIMVAVRTAAVGLDKPPAPWLPALPKHYPADPAAAAVIALVDRPAEQSQRTLLTPPGSALVLGPIGSGRTSVLRRIAWTAAADRAELLVVDAGRGLADLTGWSGLRTYLDGGDASLVQRLVRRVQDEMNQRAARGSHTPILLVIDGWEAIAGPLDALDYGTTLTTIATVAARGPTAGIRVVVSGDLRLQHHRMTSSFASIFRLAIDDRGEPVPAGPPGRGRFGPDEIQCVDCPPGTAPPAVAPRGRRAPVVRALPPAVDRRELPAPMPTAVPIGLGGDDASAQSIDLTGPGGGLLVAGPRRSGVSNTLHVLALGAVTAGIPVVRGWLRPAIAPAAAVRGPVDVDLRAGMADLRQLLLDHDGPLLLVADEVDEWPADGMSLLERFLTVAGPGQNLALGARLDRAVRANRGPIAEVAALRSGILLHADSADGILLDAALPRLRGECRPGRGHVICSGSALPLQVAALS